jgi:hypothetical protein
MAAALVATSMSATAALASGVEVRVVNLTSGQPFSQVIAWTHDGGFEPFFELGEPASEELRAIAEDGNPQPMADALATNPHVRSIAIADGPLAPGGSLTLDLDTGRGRYLSLAAMLVNTNDTFFALRGVRITLLPSAYFQPGWDAGTEDNNERCSYVPGPACPANSGNTDVDGDGEGFVFTQGGIHGIADLNEAIQDWRNPVAYIVVGRGR